MFYFVCVLSSLFSCLFIFFTANVVATIITANTLSTAAAATTLA